MRVSDYDNAEEALLAATPPRNWLLLGLILSLLLHVALCLYFYRTSFQSGAGLLRAPEMPPTFKVKNVELEPVEKPAMDQTSAAAKPEPDKTDVQLPDEKKSFDQLLQDV